MILGWFLGRKRRKPQEQRPSVAIDEVERENGVAIVLSEQEVAAVIQREFHTQIVGRFRRMGVPAALDAQRVGRDLHYGFRVRVSHTETGSFCLTLYADHPHRAPAAIPEQPNDE